jgi:hypothetical protein
VIVPVICRSEMCEKLTGVSHSQSDSNAGNVVIGLFTDRKPGVQVILFL